MADYKIEGIPVYKQLMAPAQDNFPAYAMNPTFITVHNTANNDKGADAKMHANYLQNGADGTQTSWHFTVDDAVIYQSAKLNQSCWHAGDGNGDGNRHSIDIEICENQGMNQSQANKNAQTLIRYLLDKKGILLDHVETHKHWSGKDCPHLLLPKWEPFINGIQNGASDGDSTQWHKKTGDWTGELLVRWDYGPPVKDLQQMLADVYFYPNKSAPHHGIDAYYGPHTEDAVRRFQSVHLPHKVDGKAERHTYNMLIEEGSSTGSTPGDGSAIVPYPGHLIRRGSRGKDVKRIQRAVGVGADGIFGKNTEATVRTYQKRHGLAADGIVGKKTWNMMF